MIYCLSDFLSVSIYFICSFICPAVYVLWAVLPELKEIDWKDDRRVAACRLIDDGARRRVLRDGGVSSSVRWRWGPSADTSPLRSDAARQVRRVWSRIHRLLHGRADAARPTLFRTTFVWSPHSWCRVWGNWTVPQGAQDLPGSRLPLRTRLLAF